MCEGKDTTPIILEPCEQKNMQKTGVFASEKEGVYTHEKETQTKKIDKWEFFKNEDGFKRYNQQCLGCVHTCRQSFRSEIIQCPNYCHR